VRLVIEDEHVCRRSSLGVSCRLVHFDRVDFEKRASESLVDRNEGCGQPAGAFEELPTADPELFRGGLGQLLDSVFGVLLLSRLRIRHVLAVRDHPRRNRRLERLGLRRRTLFQLFIAQPHVFFARTGMPCRVGHRFLRLFVFTKPMPFARGSSHGLGLNFNLSADRKVKR